MQYNNNTPWVPQIDYSQADALRSQSFQMNMQAAQATDEMRLLESEWKRIWE